MRLYQYRCEMCGHEEDFQFDPFEERPRREVCPQCGEQAMYRVFGEAKVHIPFQWTEDTFKFDKKPSKKRKYF